MIWIRADANREIGLGHIMRCLSVAAALKAQGQEVCFVLADEAAVEILQEKGQAYRVLHTAYDNMEAELEVFLPMLQEASPQLVLIDSYFVTAEYLEAVGKFTKTAYIDDKNSFPYPVDILINYNIYGDMLPYKENAVRENMKFLLGAAYAPLREEFCNVDYPVREQVENVLITTGGSDRYNLAGRILEQVLSDKRVKRFHYHVVSGAFNQNLPMLKEIEEKHSNVHIHQNVTNMSELMRQCDVAITAGGSTMYELCAIGVPILCFSFVDNQEQIVETFVKKDMVCYGGNYLKEQEALPEQLVEHLAGLAKDGCLRLIYSVKERKLVDGKGAEKIAQQLIT